jgi:hypothetical protein
MSMDNTCKKDEPRRSGAVLTMKRIRANKEATMMGERVREETRALSKADRKIIRALKPLNRTKTLRTKSAHI